MICRFWLLLQIYHATRKIARIRLKELLSTTIGHYQILPSTYEGGGGRRTIIGLGAVDIDITLRLISELLSALLNNVSEHGILTDTTPGW